MVNMVGDSFIGISHLALTGEGISNLPILCASAHFYVTEFNIFNFFRLWCPKSSALIVIIVNTPKKGEF